MKLIAIALLLAATLHAEPSRVLKLWNGKPPGDFTVAGPEQLTPGDPAGKPPILRLTNIAEPRLEFYEPAADKKNGAAVVIVPGGGFGMLASGHEGSDLAIWFRDRGFVAAVLQHRCPTNALPKPWEFPAQDTQRALRVLRAKAADLGVQPDRIGLFGFSAGGQVALIAATNTDQRLYPAADTTDQVSCRPDFLMLCYPWKILADNSTTELRPVTISLSSELLGRPGRLPCPAPVEAEAAAGRPPCFARAASSRSWDALRLPATCQLRSVAFGVGPLPSSF